jgi:3-oxoacyl-[acyl-carrier-protein] synthase-1
MDAWPDASRSRNNSLALAAAHAIAPAIHAAVSRYGAHRVAVVLGTSTSGIAESETAMSAFVRDGRLPAEFHFAQQELVSSAHCVASAYGLRGPAYVHSTACASSAKAMAGAARLLRRGVADAVVTGGVDTLCTFTVSGFSALDLVSARPCNPLSANRDGTNIGEGAALFLMTGEPALVRLDGWGEASDGHHFSAPDPEGRGARAAMEGALQRAGDRPGAVEYVNLHGTGTRLNDAVESAVVYALFDEVPASSTKPLTGHTLGAAGAVEAAFCWLAMQDSNQRGVLPPHVWDGERDPALPPVRLVSRGDALGHPPRRTLSASLAFGGANAALLFARE